MDRKRTGPGGRSWIGLVAVISCLSLIAGCSTSGRAKGSAAPTSTASPPKVASDGSWTSDGLPVHSWLSATKDSIVYAGLDQTDLMVTALDPSTGAERWRRPSVMSDSNPNVWLGIATDDDTAYFLTAPDRAASASVIAYRQSADTTPPAPAVVQLTAVTTATGATRWSTPITSEADANVRRCGDTVCTFVSAPDGQQLWRFDRATGAVLNKTDIQLSPGGRGDLIVSDRSANHGITSTFILASRQSVHLGQVSADGTRLDWNQPARAFYGSSDVGPTGGGVGWQTPSGWVISLGHRRDESQKLRSGDVLPPGAVAGIAADGTQMWTRPDRHACVFVWGDVPALCDGRATVYPKLVEMRPGTIEGIDPATGVTTWTVELNGSIDEYRTSTEVMRLDTNDFLLTTPTGTVHLNLTSGPTATDDTSQVGWCDGNIDTYEPIRHGSDTVRYLTATGHYPCHLGGDAVDRPATLPVPDFAGVDADGHSAWIADGRVRSVPDS